MLFANCLSCCEMREIFFGIGGMDSMSKTRDLILFKPLKNCIKWSSHFLWLIIELTKQEHLKKKTCAYRDMPKII